MNLLHLDSQGLKDHVGVNVEVAEHVDRATRLRRLRKRECLLSQVDTGPDGP